MTKQIKTKKRVADHGEVFTSEREVNAMLDLVKNETQRIDSRFLEPACGDGNFLIEILRRKLNVVKDKYKMNQFEYERYAVIAVSSCYGVDILEDNCIECRERLTNYFIKDYKSIYKENINKKIIETVEYIFNRNIVCGDALTMLQNNGKPIIFSEWSAVNGTKIKRRDYTLSNLLETESYYGESKNEEVSLFDYMRKQGTDILIPKAIAEFPIIDFDNIKIFEDDYEN